MADEPRGSRVQYRIEHLRGLKTSQVSARKRAAAAAIAVGIAVLTFYLLFFVAAGDVDIHWSLAVIAAAGGGVLAWHFGARTGPSGIISGILAGIWIFLEMIIATISLLAACAAAVLSIFN